MYQKFLFFCYLRNHSNNGFCLLNCEKDLNNSIDSYQKLLKLNNIIEKKFHKSFRSIGEETNKKVKEIIKK